jgi:hypothetical protein
MPRNSWCGAQRGRFAWLRAYRADTRAPPDRPAARRQHVRRDSAPDHTDGGGRPRRRTPLWITTRNQPARCSRSNSQDQHQRARPRRAAGSRLDEVACPLRGCVLEGALDAARVRSLAVEALVLRFPSSPAASAQRAIRATSLLARRQQHREVLSPGLMFIFPSVAARPSLNALRVLPAQAHARCAAMLAVAAAMCSERGFPAAPGRSARRQARRAARESLCASSASRRARARASADASSHAAADIRAAGNRRAQRSRSPTTIRRRELGRPVPLSTGFFHSSRRTLA